jgi:hypothetical protein
LAFVLPLKPLLSNRRKLLNALGQISLGFVVVQLLVWQIHFSLGKTIVDTLPSNGYYGASAEYKEILSAGTQSSLSSFPTMFRDSLNFFANYEKGVPDLNMCKADETGSHPLMWPLGGRSISYRWDAKDDFIRPVHLQVNPVTWGVGLIGIVLALALVMGQSLFGCGGSRKSRSAWTLTYLCLWLGYMATMLQITRAMYLYHYFIPFIFSLVLLALVWPQLQTSFGAKIRPQLRWWGYGTLVLAMVGAYVWYSPFTYAKPIPRKDGFSSRALLSVWDLHCPSCALTNTFARPLVSDTPIGLSNLKLGDLTAIAAWQ